MFSSFFSDPTVQDLHPVSSAHATSELFAPLEKADLEWTCLGGFAVETQTFYHILDDGRFLLGQVIYSSTGLWYPTVQFTFKLYNPATKETIWRSQNVKDFTSPPPGQDKRSSKSDIFTIVHRDTSSDPDYSENYTVNVQLGTDLHLSLVVSRPNSIPGVKVGKDPKTYFGQNKEKPDGFVLHKFWPRTKMTGQLTWGASGSAAGGSSRVEEIKGVGMMVNAIQGMRPNLIATRWNFCWFTGKTANEGGHEEGVSAIMMEFTTPSSYGRKKGGDGGVTVNIGNVTIGDKLIVTAETSWPDAEAPSNAPVLSRAKHLETVHDKDTGYAVPQGILFTWQGPVVHATENVKAELLFSAGSAKDTPTLIEKVDVLGEIPSFVKAVVNATGTKPYIYQWLQPNCLLNITKSGGVESQVQGHAFVEASYVS